MKYRSWLIVPGNSEKRLALSHGVGADVVVVDLADTVPGEGREIGHRSAAQWLMAGRHGAAGARHQARWVRINSFESGLWREDLAAVMPAAPEGIILPAAAGPEAVRELASEIYGHEERNGIAASATRIMPVLGASARAVLHVGRYLDSPHQRLDGLAWSASALGVALGVAQRRDRQGGWGGVAAHVRAQVLLTAHAGAMRALEAPFEDFEDEAGLERAALQARADGFSGMFAVHPAQVAVINRAFAPRPQDLGAAREIVAAFAANPHLGTMAVGGRMVDRAHLALARHTLAQADLVVDVGEELRRAAILRPA